MKLNISVYKKFHWYSIYNGDTLLHSGDMKDKDIHQIVKELGYTIIYTNIVSSNNWNITNYAMEVK